MEHQEHQEYKGDRGQRALQAPREKEGLMSALAKSATPGEEAAGRCSPALNLCVDQTEKHTAADAYFDW